LTVLDLLHNTGIIPSKTAARAAIIQEKVYIDGQLILDPDVEVPDTDHLIRIGKRIIEYRHVAT
jgi:tyrosyl-tRNA synthetase